MDSFPIFQITQRLYYSGKFQMFYQKAAVMGALVLKPCSQCLIETFVSIKHLGLYAPLRIPSKRNACKAMFHMAFGW